jgi:hypothetical protein
MRSSLVGHAGYDSPRQSSPVHEGGANETLPVLCGGAIQDAAIVRKHCGRDLTAPATAKFPASNDATVVSRKLDNGAYLVNA